MKRNEFLSEIYEAGWTIAPASYFIAPRWEESYNELENSETIRRIAFTQDEYSWDSLVYNIRRRILTKYPSWKYSPELANVINNIVYRYLFGEDMAYSVEHAKLERKKDAERQERCAKALVEISMEIKGFPAHSIDEFLTGVIAPKYAADLGDDLEAILDRIRRENVPPQRSFQTNTLKVDLIDQNAEFTHVLISKKDNPLLHTEVAFRTANWEMMTHERDLVALLGKEEYLPKFVQYIQTHFG